MTAKTDRGDGKRHETTRSVVRGITVVVALVALVGLTATIGAAASFDGPYLNETDASPTTNITGNGDVETTLSITAYHGNGTSYFNGSDVTVRFRGYESGNATLMVDKNVTVTQNGGTASVDWVVDAGGSYRWNSTAYAGGNTNKTQTFEFGVEEHESAYNGTVILPPLENDKNRRLVYVALAIVAIVGIVALARD